MWYRILRVNQVHITIIILLLTAACHFSWPGSIRQTGSNRGTAHQDKATVTRLHAGVSIGCAVRAPWQGPVLGWGRFGACDGCNRQMRRLVGRCVFLSVHPDRAPLLSDGGLDHHDHESLNPSRGWGVLHWWTLHQVFPPDCHGQGLDL